ncbi:MAG: AroM family protein [Bacillota bacterium]|jgi:protein AroM
MKKLGLITIGQSPRIDVVPEIRQIIGHGIEVMEGGALDGLTLDEVRKLYPEPGDYVLITRMKDGTQVKIAEKHILARMQDRVTELVDRGADLIGLLCTGEFPPFKCDKLIVKPQTVLAGVVAAVVPGLRLAVFTPDADQVPQAAARWSAQTQASAVHVEPASPYGAADALTAAARNVKAWSPDIVVMDCMGYTLGMKAEVAEITGKPVILARSIFARVMAELL